MNIKEEWVLIQLCFQHKCVERPGQPIFPDCLSVSCDYGYIQSHHLREVLDHFTKKNLRGKTIDTSQYSRAVPWYIWRGLRTGDYVSRNLRKRQFLTCTPSSVCYFRSYNIFFFFLICLHFHSAFAYTHITLSTTAVLLHITPLVLVLPRDKLWQKYRRKNS